eukprot:4553244-Ditylum_brightwellii.AAC.1
MTDTRFCGVLRKANTSWKCKMGHKPYGMAYHDTTPSTWARTFKATQFAKSFADFILKGICKTRPTPTGLKPSPHLLHDPRYICRLTPSKKPTNLASHPSTRPQAPLAITEESL